MIIEDDLRGECLVAGTASGRVLSSDVPLSFWGGVDPVTGRVIDKHHPLQGQDLRGRVLAIPGGRGSCGGSSALFEMVLNGSAPAALVFGRPESILTLGVVIASELFDRRIPVVRLDQPDFERLRSMTSATVVDGIIRPGTDLELSSDLRRGIEDRDVESVTLSELDQAILDGDLGEAAQVAMRIVLRAARLEGARELVDVELAHIDGVFYQGPASLKFATTVRDLGAKVRVPSSMNPICVDRRRWRDLGVPESMGKPSEVLADAYEEMGVSPTYTCAPYLLSRRPAFGQQIASGESNAVVYTNSVIGARTMKYPNYLDLLVAITGRAPNAGCHRNAERRATVVFVVEPLEHIDDGLFPILGYHIGERAPNDIPVVLGLEAYPVSADDLKAFGAAFATTSAVPMFHIVGVTPEADTLAQATGGEQPAQRHLVTAEDLRGTWNDLNSATEPEADLVSLGTPHCSLSEIARVAELVKDGNRRLRGKYAHYGAAALDRGMHLRSLLECVRAACTGRVDERPPRWLRP